MDRERIINRVVDNFKSSKIIENANLKITTEKFYDEVIKLDAINIELHSFIVLGYMNSITNYSLVKTWDILDMIILNVFNIKASFISEPSCINAYSTMKHMRLSLKEKLDLI